VQQITLDGRKFTDITHDGENFTGAVHAIGAAQEDYILMHLRLCGATKVLDGQQRPDQSHERAWAFSDCILRGGRKFYILAGCLTEVGKRWNQVAADRNERIFGDITDDFEKATMTVKVSECLTALLDKWKKELDDQAANAEGTPPSNSEHGSGPQRVN
jgi:hypothetical protein